MIQNKPFVLSCRAAKFEVVQCGKPCLLTWNKVMSTLYVFQSKNLWQLIALYETFGSQSVDSLESETRWVVLAIVVQSEHEGYGKNNSRSNLQKCIPHAIVGSNLLDVMSAPLMALIHCRC